MIHKQIYYSSYFSTAGRISRGIFIERILLTTVLFLLTYSILLHYAGENKSSFWIHNEHLIRYFLISLWLIFFLIQYVKRVHDSSLSFIQSLNNPFIIFTNGTYGSNKYGLLSDDIYYIQGVEDFNNEKYLAYQNKGNQRALRSLFLLFFAIIMILVLSMYGPSITPPPVTIITQDSTIHSFSDTTNGKPIPFKNDDNYIKRKYFDTTIRLTNTRNGNNEVTNTERTVFKLDSTETSETKIKILQNLNLKKDPKEDKKGVTNSIKKVRQGSRTKGKKDSKTQSIQYIF